MKRAAEGSLDMGGADGYLSASRPWIANRIVKKLIAMVRVSLLLEPQYWAGQLTHKNRTSAQTRFVPEVIRAL
jgi:hypothetical protein